MAKKHGGAREGAGRDPLPEIDKKSPLTIWVSNRTIKKMGGKAKTRANLKKFISGK